MQHGKWIFSGILLLLINARVFSQQLKLGKNPYVVTKSAVLELESPNQGLLFPRIADTSQINVLVPPDGMVIFYVPSLQLLLRSGGAWKPLTVSSALGSYWSTTGNAGTSAANFLGTTDLRHLYFRTNNVQALFLDSAGNVAIGASPIFSTAANREKFLVDAGGNITTPSASFNVISGKGYLNNYLQLNIQNRSPGTNASSDIVATSDNGDESNNYVDLGINSSGNTANYFGGINDAYLYNLGQNFLIGTGTAAKSLIFLTGGGVQGTNERMRIDGNGKIGIGVTSPTALLHLKAGSSTANTAPLKFTSGPLMTAPEVGSVEFLTDKYYGTITTAAARKEFTMNEGSLTTGRVPFASSSGKLTDSTGFIYAINRLYPTYLTLGAGTAAAGTAPLVMTAGTNLTTPINGAIEFNGTHFYGTIGATRYALDQQAGTVYTGSNGIALTGNNFTNTLFTGIAGNQTITAGTASGNSLTLSSTSNATKGKILFGTSGYNEANNRLGLGNNIPTEVLDVTGNVKFSGALMPNNAAGTAGYYLASAGAGASPVWSAFDTTSITGFSQKVRSLFAGTAPITYSNGQIGITQASSSTNGYLSSADWSTFNSKAGSFTSGNLTESGSSVLTITGGTNAVLGSGTSLQVSQASASQSGFLSSTDWTAFNSKQGALTFGNVLGSDFIITGGTGAVVGSGLGLTLATVNTNTGTFGSTTVVPQITVNGKGLITAVSPQTIAFPVTSVNTATGAVSLGISNLNDATITTPATNQLLQYNGTKWVNTTPSYISSAITSLNGLTAATQTFATPGTSGTAPNWSSTGSTHTLNIPLASTTSVTAGLLSYTDWNTFNNKLSTIDTGNIANFYIKSRSLLSAGTGIGYNNATGVISNSGVLSVNGNVGTLTMDTGYISSFAQKTRSLFSGTAPITYANGLIGITQASTSTNGYLSSADWNTFNSKAASYTSGNLTESGSSILTITGGTGAVLGSGTSVQVKQASTSQNGFLTSTDWNTFNNKLSTIDTGNIANFYIKSRSLLSAGTGIGYNNATGVISNSGVLSVNGNVGALTMDTGYISSFSQKTRSLFSGTAPITYANGLIGITQASTSTNGYLSSADWNTFNSKASSYTSGNLTETGSSILTITGGTGAVLGSGTSVQVKQASTSQNGFLTSTDWNTFNNKLSTIDTGNIANFYIKSRSLLSAGTGIGYNNATGVISNTGVLSVNGNVGALTMDTGYISSFSQKTRSLFSGTAPITYSNGLIGITQASTSTNGYLSSTDWNIFNSKAGTANVWSLTGNGGTTSGTNFIGTTGLQSLVMRTNSLQGFLLDSLGNVGIGSAPLFTASPNREKFLVDAGTNAANDFINVVSGKGNTNNYLQVNIQNRSAGTAASSDVVASNNLGTESINYIDMGINSSGFATGTITGAPNTAYLFATGNDFVIGNQTSGRPLRFYTTAGTVSADAVLIDSAGRVGIANAAPTQKLDVTGNIRFSGALMPNNNAGTAGYYLTSAGAGTAPTWNAFDTTSITGFSQKVRSLFAGTAPITYNNGQIGITQASTSTNGYLSSADWNTFNSKLASVTSGNLTETGSGVLTITGGTGAVLGSGTSVQVKQASTSQNGFLSSTDWNTFNNKLSTIDTTNISSFSVKVRSLFSGTAPITYSNGLIGITQASTSTNGYLSSTDWNTFNNKASTANVWSLTGNSGTNSATNFLGTTDLQHLFFRTNNVQGMVLDSLGNLGIGLSPSFTAANREKLLVDAGATSSYNVISGKGSINNYLQLNIQNKSAGAIASSDVVATADNGDETTNYVDMGINSSANTSSYFGNANDSYLYNIGQNFLIGTGSPSKSLVFLTGGGTQTTNERMRIDGSGNIGIGTNNPLNKLSIFGTNPLFLSGVQTGSLSDSLVTISSGLIKKISVSSLSSLAVSSVGLSLPSIFSVSGSPVTTTGTLTGTLVVQPANRIFAGPASGADAVPTFRSIVAADLPIATSSTLGGISVGSGLAVSPAGVLSATNTNGGTVTTVSATGTQGVSTSVTNATTTPAITIGLGAITPTSVAATGTVTGSNLSGTNTGDQTITLTGDVTGSGTGSFTTAVAPNAITYAKIQQASANKLLGNPTGSSANVSEITLGSGLSFVGSALTYTPATSGTVTSVGLSLPSIFTVTNSPVTSTGTLTGALNTQAAKLVLAGPVSGSAVPTFRALAATDLPIATNALVGGVSAGSGLSVNGSGVLSTNFNLASLSATAPVAYNNTTGVISLPKATAVADGYLSSTDWTLFNSKLSTIDTSNISNFYIKSRSLLSAGSGISYNAGTGVISSSINTASFWALNGNTVTTAKNFGTIDNNDLPFITNNTEKMRLTATGFLGIGTSSPVTALHVAGTNPLTLIGVQLGSNTDSILTIASGTVKKLPFSSLTSGTSWSLTGNSGTNSATNFLGTTDLQHLFFRTNNLQGMELDSLGNVGIGVSPFFSANREKLLVDAGTTSSYNVISGKGSINNYLQLNIQNKSAGTNASSDVVATADNGDETTNYVDMGINSSANTSNYFGNANDSYLYNIGQNFLIGTATPSKNLLFLTGGGVQSTNERMRIDGSGNVGIGVTNAANPLVVKDVAEIRRVGTMSQLLFSNTANSGDFRISGDGGDIFWQGGGSRSLQMASFWGMVLSGDRQNNTSLPFLTGFTGTSVLVASPRDATVPLGIQGFSGTQTANLTEWRASSGTVFDVVDKNGNFGLGTTAPTSKLHVVGTNPLTLLGVQTGSATDSLLTITTAGVVRKLPYSTFTTGAISSLNGLTAATQTFAVPGTTGTAPAWVSSGTAHTLNIPLASAASVTAGLLSNTDYTAFSNKVGSISLGGTVVDAATTFSVSGGAATGTRTLNTQNANLVFAGPATGAAATPTFRALVAADFPSGVGTVSSVSTSVSQGVTASVATPTTTPVISIGLGAITPTSVAATGTVTGSNLSGINTGNQTITLTGDVTGSGTGSFAATLATSGVTAGTYGNNTGTSYPYLTVDAKGRITSATSVALNAGLTSLNGLTASAQTFAIGTSGTVPAWSSTTSTHTLNIPLASTASVTEGLLSNTDWNTFNNKASTANVWSLTGNSGTTSGSNFLGTVDNKSLVFRTFNSQAMIIDSVGDVGIGDAPIFTAGANREQFLVDAGTNAANDFINVISGKASTNNYMQVNIQNRSSGTAASSDIVATNNLGTESINFIDMGINSSGNTSTGVLGGNNTAYLYATGNDFSIGNASVKPLRLFTGGTAVGNERMRIDSSGNVGIANLAPVEKLDVTGNVRFSGSIIPTSSSATAFTFLQSNGPGVAASWLNPATALNNISWALGGNTGSTPSTDYFGTPDNVGIYMRTKNIHRFYIDTLGNVAIGTGTGSTLPPAFSASPNQEKLLVDGGSTTPSFNLISGKGTINNYLQLNIQNKSTGAAASSDVVATNDAGTEANQINFVDMGVNGSGNTSAGVLGGANNAYLYATGTDFTIGNSGTGVLKLYTGTTEDMRIDAAGNVGIGTTGPSQKLDVNGNINANGSIYTDGTNTNTGTVYPGLVLGGSSSGESISSKRTTGTNQYGIDFYTASNLRMTIYNGGNVGIGTGTTAPTDKFTVAGNISPSATSGNYTLGTSTQKWNAVWATNGTIQTSDRRLKTNINNLNYGLKEVLALQPVSYNWKTTPDNNKQLGLIAQDVKKIIPEAVVGDEAKETLGMNYSELVPVLINAIKEQQKQIDDLKQQVIKLQKKS